MIRQVQMARTIHSSDEIVRLQYHHHQLQQKKFYKSMT